MRSIRSSNLVALLFVAALAVPAGAAQTAAPSYVSSEPAKGEKLHQAPDRVEVTFNEPLDQSSDLTVKDSCGRTLDDGDVAVDANTISVGIKLKPAGHYMVTYLAKGIAGLTGQAAGEFHFEVHAGTPCGKKDDDGHGNHNKNKKKKKRGGNHGSGNHGDGGGNHGGGNQHGQMNQGSHGGSGNHSSATHTDNATDHERMSARHGDGANNHGRRHGKEQRRSHGTKHGQPDHPPTDGDGQTLAAGETPFGEPNGPAVLLALALSLAVGVLGGWFLRVSGGP